MIASATASAPIALAVSHGEPAATVPVVGIIRRRDVVCSGTLVSSRIVLTAAHCFLGGVSPQGDAVSIESPIGTEPHPIPIRDIRILPSFDPTTLVDDIAVLLLADRIEAPPLKWAPAQVGVGDVLAIAGYGGEPGSGAPARRTMGMTQLVFRKGARAHFEPHPAQACRGDSGGPVLAEGAVIGVISSGDAACVGGHTAGLLDEKAIQFIREYVDERTARGGSPGTRCLEDDNCATRGCYFPPDAPARGYCSPACENDAQCATPQRCGPKDARCLYPTPSPGSLRTACAAPWDCGRGVCARTSEPQAPRCLQPCAGSDLACAPGERCVPVVPIGFVGPGESACAPTAGAPTLHTPALGQSGLPPRLGIAMLVALTVLASFAATNALRRTRRS